MPPELLTGRLSIISEPSRALILVNSEDIETETPETISLPVGSHLITLQKKDFAPFSFCIDVIAGQTTEKKVELLKPTDEPIPTGELQIESTPSHSAIHIDLEDTGLLTPETLQLAEGSHLITLKQEPDYDDESFCVEIVQDELLEKFIALSKSTGRLTITSQPSYANIWLREFQDTESKSTKYLTPETLTLTPTSPDEPITVTLKREGYEDVSFETEIIKGKEIEKHIELLKTEEEAALTVPLKTGLKITSKPSSAEIYACEENTGKITPELMLLDPGDYEFTIKKSGYENGTATVTIKEGEVLEKFVELRKGEEIEKTGVRIISTPTSASIFLGEEHTDTGKITPELVVLNPGTHEITVKRGGYENQTVSITIEEGEIREKHFELVEIEGATPDESGVKIITRPTAASIYINGSDTGKITPELVLLNPGTHSITVKKEGHEDKIASITIKEEEVLEKYIELTKIEEAEKSGVRITSKPTAGSILINGMDTRKISPELVILEPGTHEITIKKAGYEDKTVSITIEGGEILEKFVELKKIEDIAKTGIKIISTPSSASIFISEKDTGKITPEVLMLDPETDEITITLKKEGYLDRTVSVTVLKGEISEKHIELTKIEEEDIKKTGVKIVSSPSSAAISVGLENTKRITPEFLTLDPGTHEISLKRAGYSSETVSVTIKRGEQTEKFVELEKIEGTAGEWPIYGITDSSGCATVMVPSNLVPHSGSHVFSAFFQGDETYVSSSCTAALTVTPRTQTPTSESKTVIQADAKQKAQITCYETPSGLGYGGEVRVATIIKNVGDVSGGVVVRLLDADTGKLIDEEPKIPNYLQPGETCVANISSDWWLGAMPAKDWNLRIEAFGSSVDIPDHTVNFTVKRLSPAPTPPPGAEAKAQIMCYEAPSELEEGKEVRVSTIIKNVGNGRGVFWMKLIDNDTGKLIEREPLLAKTLDPDASFADVLDSEGWLGAMPAKDWNLRIEAGHLANSSDHTVTFTVRLVGAPAPTPTPPFPPSPTPTPGVPTPEPTPEPPVPPFPWPSPPSPPETYQEKTKLTCYDATTPEGTAVDLRACLTTLGGSSLSGKQIVFNLGGRELTGKLHIESKPPHADIWVGGTNTRLLTPETLTVTPGTQSIKLTKIGYDDYWFSTVIPPNGKAEKLCELIKSTGDLFIASSPAHARIWIGGMDTQLITPEKITLPPGNKTIKLTFPSFIDFAFSVNITKGAKIEKFHRFAIPRDSMMSEDSILDSAFFYTKTRCIKCDESPEYDVLFADGNIRAWLCEKHCTELVKEQHEKINAIRRIDNGKATNKFSENSNPNVLTRFIREAGVVLVKDDENLAPVYPSGTELGEKITRDEVLQHLKSFYRTKPFVSLIGGICNRGSTTGDIDVFIRSAHRDLATEFRIIRMFPEKYWFRFQFHYPYEQESHPGVFTNHIDIYDEKIEAIHSPELVLMSAPKKVELFKFAKLLKPAHGRYKGEEYSIDKLIEVVNAKPEWYEKGTYVQKKFDGVHVRCDVQKNYESGFDVIIWSEEGNDITKNLPTLRKELGEASKGHAISIVGELESWSDEKHQSRQQTTAIIHTKEVHPDEKNVILNAFDCLYYDKDIHNEPHSERLKSHAKIKDTEHIKKAPYTLVHSPTELRKAVEHYSSLPGSEGAYLKRSDFPYELDGKSLLNLKYKNTFSWDVAVKSIDKIKGADAWSYLCVIEGEKGEEVPCGKTYNTSIGRVDGKEPLKPGDILKVEFVNLNKYIDPETQKVWYNMWSPNPIPPWREDKTKPDNTLTAEKLVKASKGTVSEKSFPKRYEDDDAPLTLHQNESFTKGKIVKANGKLGIVSKVIPNKGAE